MTINMKKLMERLTAVEETVTDSQMARDSAINTLVDLILTEAESISCTRPDCTSKEFEGMVNYVLKSTIVNLKNRTKNSALDAVDMGRYGDELKRRK